MLPTKFHLFFYQQNVPKYDYIDDIECCSWIRSEPSFNARIPMHHVFS